MVIALLFSGSFLHLLLPAYQFKQPGEVKRPAHRKQLHNAGKRPSAFSFSGHKKTSAALLQRAFYYAVPPLVRTGLADCPLSSAHQHPSAISGAPVVPYCWFRPLLRSVFTRARSAPFHLPDALCKNLSMLLVSFIAFFY